MNWRLPNRVDRQIAHLWGGVAASLLLLYPLWWALLPGVPSCPLRAFAGIPCPSCGTTRAATALLEGHLLEGLLMNPLAALAALALVGGGLAAPLWVRLGGRVLELPRPLPAGIRAAIGLGLLANWAYLLVSGI